MLTVPPIAAGVADREIRENQNVTGGKDLDDRILALEAELAALHQRRRDRDDADLLLAIFQTTDTWFTAKELIALAPLVPALSGLARISAKSFGRRLGAIVDAQDRAGTIPAVRLVCRERSTAGALWKIEIARPACEGHGTGR